MIDIILNESQYGKGYVHNEYIYYDFYTKFMHKSSSKKKQFDEESLITRQYEKTLCAVIEKQFKMWSKWNSKGYIWIKEINLNKKDMKMKLNQVIAVEKGVKNQTNRAVSDSYKALQVNSLFEGMNRVYNKSDEDGVDYPAESTRVQKNAQDMVRELGNSLTELFNVTATKDWANCKATADVVVSGDVLLKSVPTTYLLFLEKQLTDVHSFVGKLPVLDPAYDWSLDDKDGLFKTAPTSTIKTKKVTKALVLYDATDRHPAQTDKIVEDVIVGHWNTVKVSGAVTETTRKTLLNKVELLQKAVKFAREEANGSVVSEQKLGEAIFSWLLS